MSTSLTTQQPTLASGTEELVEHLLYGIGDAGTCENTGASGCVPQMCIRAARIVAAVSRHHTNAE